MSWAETLYIIKNSKTVDNYQNRIFITEDGEFPIPSNLETITVSGCASGGVPQAGEALFREVLDTKNIKKLKITVGLNKNTVITLVKKDDQEEVWKTLVAATVEDGYPNSFFGYVAGLNGGAGGDGGDGIGYNDRTHGLGGTGGSGGYGGLFGIGGGGAGGGGGASYYDSGNGKGGAGGGAGGARNGETALKGTTKAGVTSPPFVIGNNAGGLATDSQGVNGGKGGDAGNALGYGAGGGQAGSKGADYSFNNSNSNGGAGGAAGNPTGGVVILEW